jgi:hypothetical protein
MQILNKLAGYNLQPRSSASEYQELYADLKGVAKQQDNKKADDQFRAGEVWIKGPSEDVRVNFGYQRDEGYVGESISLSHTSVDEQGHREAISSLRAGPTESSGRYLRFTHLTDTDGDLNYEESHTFMVDTTTGTLFQEV